MTTKYLIVILAADTFPFKGIFSAIFCKSNFRKPTLLDEIPFFNRLARKL